VLASFAHAALVIDSHIIDIHLRMPLIDEHQRYVVMLQLKDLIGFLNLRIHDQAVDLFVA
jgi:hypothetical protein